MPGSKQAQNESDVRKAIINHATRKIMFDHDIGSSKGDAS